MSSSMLLATSVNIKNDSGLRASQILTSVGYVVRFQVKTDTGIPETYWIFL